MPATRNKEKERAREAEFEANRLAHEAKIAARDARTIEFRNLGLARAAERARAKPHPTTSGTASSVASSGPARQPDREVVPPRAMP